MTYCGIVFTGPKAIGKSTLARELCSRDARFAYVPAVTTRDKRKDDTPGEYHYLTKEKFEELKSANQLLIATEYQEHCYGIRHEDIQAIWNAKKIPILTITPKSASEHYGITKENWFKNPSKSPEFLTFFLDAPDAILNERLSDRNIGDNQQHEKLSKLREKQRKIDREYANQFIYLIQNIQLEQSIDLIVSLWNQSGTAGVLPARLIRLMIECGMLLRSAELKNISGASYDLSLGDDIFYGGVPHKLNDNCPIHMIEPYDYAIVTSREIAYLPSDVCARFDLSVSLFCQGIILSNGPQVDPGFQGPLFCLLFNTSNSPVILKRGQHYSTIEFHKLIEPTYYYSGQYQEKKLIDYLPANAAQGAINELKKEVERVREESTKLQVVVMTIMSLIIAFIVIWITLK